MSEEVEALKRKCNELEIELAAVKTERDDYAATVDEFIKDHKYWQQKALTPEKRDRILAALGVGKQSPQYKRVKAVLDQIFKQPLEESEIAPQSTGTNRSG